MGNSFFLYAVTFISGYFPRIAAIAIQHQNHVLGAVDIRNIVLFDLHGDWPGRDPACVPVAKHAARAAGVAVIISAATFSAARQTMRENIVDAMRDEMT